MRIRNTAILFLALAYVILLGHSFIPHHHHNHDTNTHHEASHHEHDAGTEGLNHIFAHFTHESDGLFFTANHNISSAFSKNQISFPVVISDNSSVEYLHLPALLLRAILLSDDWVMQVPHLFRLRAPPTAFI